MKSNMAEEIECIGMRGGKVMVSRENISHRPSVYGIVLFEGRILLTVTKTTGKYWLPGGGIDIGERMQDALKREIWEECGIEIEQSKQLFCREQLFYYEPLEKAWHVHLIFYSAKPINIELVLNDHADESTNPQWVDIAALKSSDFQGFGEDIVSFLRQKANV